MVIIKIAGGLGNQMFQYALARALAYNGRAVYLDCSGFDMQSDKDTKRVYELGRFDIVLPKVSQSDVKKYCNKWQYFLNYIGRLINKDISKIIIEKDHCYRGEIAECEDKFLIGYWQTEKYFGVVRKELLHDFSFDKQLLSSRNQRLRDEILADRKAVAVHIRGGDYNFAGNVNIYGNICNADYYKRAFIYIERIIGEANYYLFTNDFVWANQLISYEGRQIKIVDWNSEENGWVDMYLMSICKHNIIANSSFSWWAAWLNQNKEKTVIAPDRWQNGTDLKDIVPDEWIKI